MARLIYAHTWGCSRGTPCFSRPILDLQPSCTYEISWLPLPGFLFICPLYYGISIFVLIVVSISIGIGFRNEINSLFISLSSSIIKRNSSIANASTWQFNKSGISLQTWLHKSSHPERSMNSVTSWRWKVHRMVVSLLRTIWSTIVCVVFRVSKTAMVLICMLVKVARHNSIHVSPTALWNGLVASEVSSSWAEKEWNEFFASKIWD